MDIVDTLLSFVPFLMIILFISRIVRRTAKKKGRYPGPSDFPSRGFTAKPGIKTQGKAPKGKTASAGSPAVPAAPLPADDLPESANRAAEAAPPEPEKTGPPKTAAAAPSARPMPAAMPVEINPAYSAREKINRLPELKRAVIWSEILAPPKGLAPPD